MSLPQIISASAASQAPLQISGGVFTHAEGNISQHVHLAPEKEFDAGFQLLQRYINGDALYNSEQRFPPPKCHPQTRIAVQEALQSWAVSQDGPNVLWLHGPAGAGKSAIAQTMAETWSTSAHLAAAFFFARWRTGGAIGAKLFPTLAYQFALRFPGLRRPVGSAMEEDPGICDKTFEEQARVLIRDPFLDSELTWDYASPHLVVIDGLDECDSKVAQTRIIKIISELLLARDVPHRFLICSRPEPHIRAAFDSLWASGLVYQQLMLDDEFKPSHDIRLYLTESFEQLRDRLPMTTSPHWPSKEDLDLLVRKASGQFIYAATVLKFVDDEYSDPQERLRLILDADPSFDEESASAFADLDRLYYVILSANPNTMLVKQILGAYFALPGFGELKIEVRVISFLDGILGLPVGTTRRALRGIHSLFSIPSRDIRDNQGDDVQITPYHASLQDFLYSRPRSREFFLDAEHHHENLMARCLEITLLPLDDLNRHWSWQRNLILYSQNCWSDHFVDTPAQVTLIASSLERLQGLLAPQEFLRHSPGAMLRRIGGIVDFVSGLLVRARHGPQRPLPPNIIDACNSLANTLFLTMFQPSPESRQFYDTREIQVRHSSKHLTASPRCRKVIQIRSTLGAVMLALTSEPRLRCKVEEFLRANRLHPDICLRAAKVSLELLLYRTAEINDLLRTSKTCAYCPSMYDFYARAEQGKWSFASEWCRTLINAPHAQALYDQLLDLAETTFVVWPEELDEDNVKGLIDWLKHFSDSARLVAAVQDCHGRFQKRSLIISWCKFRLPPVEEEESSATGNETRVGKSAVPRKQDQPLASSSAGGSTAAAKRKRNAPSRDDEVVVDDREARARKHVIRKE